MKKRTVGHTETTISGDTRADWSEAFELAPSLEVAYVWHASKFTREVLDGLLRIGFIQGELRVGNRDIAALCLALLDWSTELRILQNEKRRQAGTRRREGDGIASAQELTE